MSAVEIRLNPGDLSREMAAMRVWLDQHRFEPSGFSCRDADDAMLVSLEFKMAHQAEAFAERFGGRASGGSSKSGQSPAETGLSSRGFVG